ncbi:DUF1800 domain-containing protein [Paraflavitalea pollutisoli]|uniref:DUF1800 domain-containing protein n=1 Tax=Paraflavitalea pollutisoli TaxID=3034143 RepID=UPI0023EB3353|nr:DUF1800 domain-containing protein [Paraflavitalea sp. H1-2-19X]
MDRRSFLLNRKPVAAAVERAPAGLRGITTGIAPYAGPWTRAEVAHLLKRTMFGAKKADIDFFLTLSPGQAIDTLLTISPAPAPPVKTYDNTGIAAGDPEQGIASGSTWVDVPTKDEEANEKRVIAWKSWWIGQMINQNRSITEKLVLFWHHHFATEASMYRNGISAYRHYQLLHAQALGNFKQLVRAVTLDLAMLRYLNGYLNRKEAPDENYGRELQELFTLGKENNPNYTEPDVLAAARVLTGWTIDLETETVQFDPERHDTTSKSFSTFYGTTIAGRSDATAGDVELDELLNMIFNKQREVSEFIVRKLYRWFCYYIIDPVTETNVIKPLAQLFVSSNWDIKPVLATLFKSEHFFDVLNQGCLIKSPIDHTVGLCREFNVQFPADAADTYNMWSFIMDQSGNMGMNIGDPPGVSGWPAYYQLPQFHEMWINSDTLPKRNMFTDLLIVVGYMRDDVSIQVNPVAFAKTLSNPSDPNILINDSLDILYRVPLSEVSKQTLKKQILLTNQDQDYYWTTAWTKHINNPGDDAAYQVVLMRLTSLYKYLMNLAEYQLS